MEVPGSTTRPTCGRSVLPQLPAIPINGSAARISGRVLTPAIPTAAVRLPMPGEAARMLLPFNPRSSCNAAPPDRRLQRQHSLVGAAGPGPRAIGKTGNIRSVDEHVDLVEHSAYGRRL